MRILQVNKFFDLRGGTERVLFDLRAGLVERGHEVVDFAQADDRNEPSAYAAFFPRARDYDSGSLLARARAGLRAIHDGEARTALARLLDAHPVDVAHLHNIYHQLSPSILDELRARRIPTLMTVHDYKLVCPNYRLYRGGQICDECVGRRIPIGAALHRCQRDSVAESWLVAIESTVHRLRRVYERGVDRFVAPSEFLAETLRRHGFEGVEVVRNAPRRSDDPAPPEARAERATLLYAGRLSAEKGVELLVRAAADVPLLELRIAGTGPLDDALRELAAGAGNVVFLGHLDPDALARERAAAWAIAVPSLWYENAPLSVLEAFASARPAFVSAHGGLLEMVDDGVEGWRLPPGDVDAWTAALRALPGQAERCARMGAAARTRLERDHDYEDFVTGYLNRYEALCGGRSSG